MTQSKRFGFHYFNDTLHYTNHDLVDWLPILKRLNVSTLILKSAPSRAIPEHFLSALIGAEISPVIHIPMVLPDVPSPADVKAIFEAYARWGIRYVILFDKPNSNQSWTSSSWVQQGLVERFLDKFIPLANAAIQAGLTPVFPPLEPGGSYWDTIFLKSSMQSLQRRKQNALIDHMAVAAYGFTNNHPLEWGQGGPAKWTGNLPYSTPENSQDQRGFRIFEWYDAIIQQTIQKRLPIFLLGTGIVNDAPGGGYPEELHQRIVSEMLNTLSMPSEAAGAIPDFVVSCNFMRLSASADAPEFEFAWFDDKDHPRQTAAWLMTKSEQNLETPPTQVTNKSVPEDPVDPAHPIKHYVLLPSYEWGISDWHLDAIKPFVKKHQPTIGFSIQEAMLASKVTLIGGEQSFSKGVEEELTQSGCAVERIAGDGTTIATILAER